MAPNLRLRNVLETMVDLTLKRFIEAFKSTCRKSSAADLYRQFTPMSKLPEESTYDFTIGCLEMEHRSLLLQKQYNEITQP